MATDELTRLAAKARPLVQKLFGDSAFPNIGNNWQTHHLIPAELFGRFSDDFAELGVNLKKACPRPIDNCGLFMTRLGALKKC